MYVSCTIGAGLGNRLFQIAAMLGYAEKYGYNPVFVKEWIHHNSTQLGGNSVFEHFPDIPTISGGDLEWTEIKEPFEGAMTYRELPAVKGNVKLNGYFQSERYFPKGGVRLSGVVPKTRWYPTFFLHVRRGDYLHPANAHHYVDLTRYYERALSLYPSGAYILVCSDDIAWCKATLPLRYPEVGADKWIWFSGDEYATLGAMMGCSLGGICANSTFSWWGAYLNRGSNKLITMPDRWIHSGGGVPAAIDIYPTWAERVSV
jgi:hypothetical protein